MAYNQDRDKCIAEVGTIEVAGGSIKVGLWSYAGGPKKIGMTRTFLKRDGSEGTGAIGRVTKEEMEQLLPLLQKALDTI